MEQQSDSDTEERKRRSPFANFHKKIHFKYLEMQKRLNKSKSVDSIASLSEEFNFREGSMCSSNSDLREEEDRYSTSSEIRETIFESDNLMCSSIVIEEVSKSIAVEEDAFEEANFLEAKTTRIDNDLLPLYHFNLSKSTESLYEVPKEKISEDLSTTPTPTMSIRDRIGSRISAVKEKKRQLDIKDTLKNRLDKGIQNKLIGNDSLPSVAGKLVLSNRKVQDQKKKNKSATVTIALIEAKEPGSEASDEKMSSLICRISLGSEKRKSKPMKSSSSLHTFQDLLTLSMYDETALEITMWDRDTFLGRSSIDLSEIEKEKTHRIRLNLEDGVASIQLFMLLTISGITAIDVATLEEEQRKVQVSTKTYPWYNPKDEFTNVGSLTVLVYGAKGLSGNECYCVLKLVNDRLQTHAESKTNNPNWMKMFSFTVTDISAILNLTVIDKRKTEEVGKLSIPLLKIKSGKKVWYALKDTTLRERAKGNDPRILLEMTLTWNLIKASIRVINPKEVCYLEIAPKFQRHLFTRNVSRARAIINWILSILNIIKTCFEWESRRLNIIALSLWLLFCWFFKIWMIPLLFLWPFFWYGKQKNFLIKWRKRLLKEEINEEPEEKEDKSKSLRQKIITLQEIVQTVQNAIGKIASLGESVKNLFNFSVPFLSYLAIFFILVISFLFFIIPTKYIFIGWGIHKFTRKIFRPNLIPNNEILDLLSRVPDDETLLDCKELEVLNLEDEKETQI